MTDERWLTLPGFPKYEISTDGNVRHIPWRLDGSTKNLKPFYNKGYPFITIRANDKHKKLPVHRFVLLAFRGEPPEPHMQACHLDGQKANCRLDNLVWGCAKTNTSHKRTHGTWPGGERNRLNKVKEQDIPKIREQLARGRLQKDVAFEFGISRSAVSMIKTGATWRHIPPATEKLTQGKRLEIR